MTATDDGVALLAAVRAHPLEDTPRLMYADWLDEQPERCGLCRGAGEHRFGHVLCDATGVHGHAGLGAV